MTKQLSHKEVSRKGGNATKAKYGADHFKKLINKRWAKQKRKNILDDVKKIFSADPERLV